VTRPALALVPPLPAEPVTETVAFCSHCADRPDAVRAGSRVCPSCGFGLLLHAAADAAPGVGDAFMVLDSTLAVCGLSREAEKLLAALETDVVDRPVTDLVVPADAEAQERGSLAAAIAWAARGDGTTRRVTVRPANTFGVRLPARIVACGPPSGALLIFD
jgi:hypothetical protein